MVMFRSILYVNGGAGDDTSLFQSLNLAHSNGASLSILVLCPELKGGMSSHREEYERSLIEKMQKSIKSARKELKVSEAEISIHMEVEAAKNPAISIIQRVLRDEHDLVVKEAERQASGKGFKALDLDLLRKCPCPVWLSRNVSGKVSDLKIAVAVDPEIQDAADLDLSLDLLKKSASLAQECSEKLTVVSCWGAGFENGLIDNALLKIPQAEIAHEIDTERKRHEGLLADLISKAGLSGSAKIIIEHIKGHASNEIPKFVHDQNIDLLVMGTVARTGIAGYFIGNTAEDVLHELDRSLLALKPSGFISSVKAY